MMPSLGGGGSKGQQISKFTGAGRQYIFESQPVASGGASKLKRVRSQTAAVQDQSIFDDHNPLSGGEDEEYNRCAAMVALEGEKVKDEQPIVQDSMPKQKLSLGLVSGQLSPTLQKRDSVTTTMGTAAKPMFALGGTLQQSMQFQQTTQLMLQQHQQEQHESVENLYTLKKVQSKVRDKIVPWIDFSSTSATFQQRQTEETTAGGILAGGSLSHQDSQCQNPAINATQIQQSIKQAESKKVEYLQDFKNMILYRNNTGNKGGNSSHFTLSQINFRKKQYGSPADKMQTYNFFQVGNPNLAGKKHQDDKSFDRKSQKNLSAIRDDNFGEESLCITEENRFQNEINPIKLADLGWGDDYKLTKLIKTQIQSVDDGRFDPEAYFGGVPEESLAEAFSWFEISRKEFEDQILRRKSSAGLMNPNTFAANQSLIDFGAKFPSIIDLNKGPSIISPGGAGGFQDAADFFADSSSSDDEGDDEAEKFKNTFLKSNGSKFHLLSKHQQSNLLLKAQQLEEAEDDFNKRTPKVLSSDGGDSDKGEGYNEEEKENRPLLKIPMGGKFEVLEELIEESREESVRNIGGSGGDSRTQFYIPAHLAGNPQASVADLISHQQQYEQQRLEPITELKEVPLSGNTHLNNRLYDSDIFVMSNTTFDEELASMSSRRVSAGRQPYKNEFMNFVDNSQDLKQQHSQNARNNSAEAIKQLDGITQKLFFHQQNMQLLQRRQVKQSQHQQSMSNGNIKQESKIKKVVAGQNPAKRVGGTSNIKERKHADTSLKQQQQLSSQLQAILSPPPGLSVGDSMVLPGHSSTSQQQQQLAQQSITKFSNYVSSSNNLTPTPNAYAKAFQKYKEVKGANKSQRNQTNTSQYNSQHNSNMVSNLFQMHSGHQSIISQSSALHSNNGGGQNSASHQNRFGSNKRGTHQYLVTKSHSNENFSRQVIAINTSLMPQGSTVQKVTHHSPQCSIMMRPNLSPGPSYKMKERNSMMLYENSTRNNIIHQHLSESDLYGNSNSKYVLISASQQLPRGINKAQNQQQQQQIKSTNLSSKQSPKHAQAAGGGAYNITNLQSKRTTTTTYKAGGGGPSSSNLRNAAAGTSKKTLPTRNEYSDKKQSNINSTFDSLGTKNQQQHKTLTHNELKQSLNAAKLKKQRSDTKIATSSNVISPPGGLMSPPAHASAGASNMVEGQNSMITYKLMSMIKQHTMNKKIQQQQQEQQASSIIEETTQTQQPTYQLNRQRSKSEIETVYEVGQKQLQGAQSRSKVPQPLSPSRSMKTIYQNGKTMADINKFFEDNQHKSMDAYGGGGCGSSESGTGSKSVMNYSKNQQTSKMHNTGSGFYGGGGGGESQNYLGQYNSIEPSSCKTFDVANLSQGSISNLNQFQYSISGSGILKEPSTSGFLQFQQQPSCEMFTGGGGGNTSTQNSPLLWEMKKSRQLSNQSLKLNFGIQPHTNHNPQGHHQYHSPTHGGVQSSNILSQSYQITSIHMLANATNPKLAKENSSQHHDNSSIVDSTVAIGACDDHLPKASASQFSVAKQRIQKSPNKKSMMVLNSSIGSSSNNLSMILGGQLNQATASHASQGGASHQTLSSKLEQHQQQQQNVKQSSKGITGGLSFGIGGSKPHPIATTVGTDHKVKATGHHHAHHQ